MNKFILRQTLLLLLAALIWGVAFVAQSVGMEYVEPFTFSAVRSIIGGISLLPVILILGAAKRSPKSVEVRSEADVPDSDQTKFGQDAASSLAGSASSVTDGHTGSKRRQLLTAGISCGILLCIATNLQQIGIQYTTVGKGGFITAMYIVIVPLLGLAIGKKAGMRVWAAVVLAVAGLFFLCMAGSTLALQKGDLLMLLCAVAFSFQILSIDYFASKVDGVKLACIQFLVCGFLSGICMLLFEHPQLSQILAAWLPILYAGMLSCGVAYTLQIIGQRGMNPAVASLIMSLEAVISVISGWAILHQSLSGRELFGCVLMLLAIVLVQLPEREAP